MIQANCRARFTAADFDFVVRTLSRSRREAVSLVELLSDSEVRDAVLDNALLAEALLSQPAHLAISPQFYFYVLVRHVLKEAGIIDRRLCDYIASLLERFSETARLALPTPGGSGPCQYLSDILLALRNASPAQAFFIRAHAGNYSLFISGIFHENVTRRTERGGPTVSFYEDVGRTSYRVVAGHAVARSCELTDIYETLAADFHEVRLALNRLADRLIHLETPPIYLP